MENPVDEIKKRLDIVEFIGSFITLKRAGRNFKALCPFHQEKTPSFVISPERQIWHCFGACGEGGDAIKFLMKWEHITFFEALKELAKKTGVRLKETAFEDRVWKKKEHLLTMNQLAIDFFEYILHKTKFGEKGLGYLKTRGIHLPIAKKFQLGYAPLSWDSLLKFLKKKKFDEEEMLENGLVVKGERGGFYDRFRSRLIFPIKDARGQVIGFSGRTLDDKEKEAKYINTPETPIYHKRETLFGIDKAKESIKEKKNVFVVEGELDMISPYQQGFTNFVAIKGTAVTRDQLMLLKRYTNRITLALDADLAGEEAVRRGIEEAERLDFEIEVVTFDFAKDPDEAIKKDVTKFKKTVTKPLPIYDFLIEAALKKYPTDDPFNKKKIGEEVIPFIEHINNPIVQSHYIKKLSSLLAVAEGSIERLIQKEKQKKKQAFMFLPKKKEAKDLREFLIQKYILSLIFQSPNPYKTAERIFSILSPEDLTLLAHQKICKLFLLGYEQDSSGKFNLNQFTAQLSEELRQAFDELYLFASSEHNLEKENVDKLAYEIKRFALKRKIKDALSLKEISSDKEANYLTSLNTNLKEVEKLIMSL